MQGHFVLINNALAVQLLLDGQIYINAVLERFSNSMFIPASNLLPKTNLPRKPSATNLGPWPASEIMEWLNLEMLKMSYSLCSTVGCIITKCAFVLLNFE